MQPFRFPPPLQLFRPAGCNVFSMKKVASKVALLDVAVLLALASAGEVEVLGA